MSAILKKMYFFTTYLHAPTSIRKSGPTYYYFSCFKYLIILIIIVNKMAFIYEIFLIMTPYY